MKYIEAIYDCDTDTETFVEREFTAEQLAAQKELADARKAAADKEATRNAVYAKLGLTADEIAALIG
jgi:hypothetical protein